MISPESVLAVVVEEIPAGTYEAPATKGRARIEEGDEVSVVAITHAMASPIPVGARVRICRIGDEWHVMSYSLGAKS